MEAKRRYAISKFSRLTVLQQTISELEETTVTDITFLNVSMGKNSIISLDTSEETIQFIGSTSLEFKFLFPLSEMISFL